MRKILISGGVILLLGVTGSLLVFSLSHQNYKKVGIKSLAPSPLAQPETSAVLNSPQPSLVVETSTPFPSATMNGLSAKKLPTPSVFPMPSPMATEVPPLSTETPLDNWQELISATTFSLLCGNEIELSGGAGKTVENWAFGSAFLINSEGILMTNDHVVYDKDSKILRNDCFLFNQDKWGSTERIKIYYAANVAYYNGEKTGIEGSEIPNHYRNDYALVKIIKRLNEATVPEYINYSYTSWFQTFNATS